MRGWLKLWSMVVMVLGGLAFAQGSGWVSEAGLAWLAAAGVFAAIGTPITREVVDYLRGLEGVENWLKRRFKSNGVRLLAFVVALVWSWFWFRPGLLDLEGLLVIPQWLSIPILAGIIAARAGGQKDAQKQGLVKLEAVAGTFEAGEPSSAPERRGS